MGLGGLGGLGLWGSGSRVPGNDDDRGEGDGAGGEPHCCPRHASVRTPSRLESLISSHHSRRVTCECSEEDINDDDDDDVRTSDYVPPSPLTHEGLHQNLEALHQNT